MFFIQTPDWKDIPELLKEFDTNFIESIISSYDHEDFKEILPMSLFEDEYNGFIRDFVEEYNKLWERSDHREVTTFSNAEGSLRMQVIQKWIPKDQVKSDLVNIENNTQKDRAEIICSALEYFDYDPPQEIFDTDRR